MEFLGKMVKKEFKGFGVFDGVVDSFDSATGFFKILYEDGDSEDADFSEVSRLVSAAVSGHIPAEEAEPTTATAKRVGRKPKKRRGIIRDPGKDSENLDCSLEEQSDLGQIEQGLGGNLVNQGCVNGDLNEINGLDLNRGLNFDDGVEKVETVGCIDLNLTVVNDEFDEDVEKKGENKKEERNFDLNLGLSDENLNGVNENNSNLCTDFGKELQSGASSVACTTTTATTTTTNVDDSTRVDDIKIEESSPGTITPTPCEDGDSGRRKRRRVTRNLMSPTETVLRRSARRAKAVALNECNMSRVLSMDGANDLSMSGVTDESEENPCDIDLGRPREKPPEKPWALPTQIELPPSSTNLNLEGIPVLDLFFVYSCLRSFSTLLYLSPFELEDLVAALKSRVSNLLIDFIHVSILQTLRKHLEFLASEGSESASTCLRNMNWDLLDVITWPVFMVEYLLIHGSGLKPGFGIGRLNLFDGEYYTQPAAVKLELLRCLCDDVIEVEATRSELSKRVSMTDLAMEMDRTTNYDLYKKRRISSGARVDTNFSEDIAEEVADGNSDECCLCKMDGNLICCDGCPAAYHTKCVGIVSNLLPEGEWYCPECMVAKPNLDTKPQKLIRGAELLGIDPYGRLFFSCFNYLLVSDSYDAESSFTYYHKNDLGSVVQLLRSYDVFYEPILSAISQQWGVSTDLHEPKSSSEGSGEVLQSNQLTPNSPRPGSSDTADPAAVTNNISASKKRKRNRPSAVGRPKSSPKTKEEDAVQGNPGNPEDVYTNCYSFARTASLVVEELLRKPSDRGNAEPPKTEEEIISIQSKFILKKSTKCCWPPIQDLGANRHKEKCGWCYCCRFPVEGRECLFSSVNKGSVANLKSELGDLLLKKNKQGHLVDVICGLLYMEQRLRGLLLGPWLSPNYSELWRNSVLKASDVSSLKRPLLALESNLHPLAISADWLKLVDSAATMGSASHFVASLRALSKNGIGRRRIRCGDSEIKALVAVGGLGLFWWRGGKVSRSLFNWKVVPRSLALKAARNAGRIKIPGLQYPDGSEGPKRSRCIAWRAAVETSTSVEQLALQVRELDMFLRWHDIENTHPPSALDKESLKSVRLFKKSIIRRKCVEGTLVKYLIDFGKRRCVPDVVHKHGTKVEDPSGEKKKFWLEESYVPLHLLRGFGERRIARKASKPNSGKARKNEKSAMKPPREKGFDYLFARAERADSHQCGHCNKHVPVSEAVSCEYCNGFFHKRHVTRSSGGALASESTYTCHQCRASNSSKNDSKPGKRKVGKLQGVKNFKVETQGRLGKLRGKARGRGRPLSSTGVVLSGKNTKKRGRGRPRKNHSSLQENNANAYSGMTLRRSARQAAHKPVQPKGSAGGKKKKKKRNYKAKKVAPKETTPISTCRKRSIRAVDSLWINGLLLSKRENDERAVEFKRRKLVIPSDELSARVDDSPIKCSLCPEQGFVPSSVYIACDACGDWFHGDAFGLNEENIELLIGFKCHGCREKSPPACPFDGISRDTNEVGTQNGQGSSEEVCVQKETDCVLEMHSDEAPPAGKNPVGKSETEEDSSATNVDQGTQNDQGSSEEVCVQKETDCVLEMHSDEALPAGKNPVGKPETEEDSSAINVDQGMQNNQGSSEEVCAQKETDCVLEMNSDEVPPAGKNPVGKSETEEDSSATNVDQGTQNAQGSSEEVCVQKETDCVLEMHSDEVPPSVKNPVGKSETEEDSSATNTDHDIMAPTLDFELTTEEDIVTPVGKNPVGKSETEEDSSATNVDHDIMAPTLDSESRAENETSGSPTKVISNTIEAQSGNRTDLSADCKQESHSNDVSLASSDHVKTSTVDSDHDIMAPTLDSELRAENGTSGSPTKVISNAIETQSENRTDLSADCKQESHSNDVSLASSDHVKTSTVDPELILENGSSPTKEVEANINDCQNGSLNPDGVSLGCSEVPSVENTVDQTGPRMVVCDAIESLKGYLNADDLSEDTEEAS